MIKIHYWGGGLLNRKSISIVIMAAGKGTRMMSDIPKVIHKIANETLLNHVINTSIKLNPKNIVVVIGYRADAVRESVKEKNIKFSLQIDQKGTGHAVMQTKEHLKSFQGHTLVLSGDVPLISHNTLESLINKQIDEDLSASVLTADLDDPHGYGRVIRDKNNNLQEIKEHKDCSEEQLQIKEINSGIYIFNNELLFKLLPKIDNNNSQSEYYLPDILSMIVGNKGKIGLDKINDIVEIQGINTNDQLENLEKEFNKRIK